jgi:hypothetical protein
MRGAVYASLVTHTVHAESDGILGRQIQRNSVHRNCKAALLLRESIPKRAYGLYGKKKEGAAVVNEMEEGSEGRGEVAGMLVEILWGTPRATA